jgi:hypothetical protein
MKTRLLIAAAASLAISLSTALAVALPVSAADAPWTATYWNNTTLKGHSVATRTEKRIAYDWRKASPIPGTVNRDKFSVRWTRVINFKAGTYIFRTYSDDGIRVWIDNKQLINQWNDHAYQTAFIPYAVSAGNHTLKVEYYDKTGPAVANFSIASLKANPWDAQYYKGVSLGGRVIVEQEENGIRNYWGGDGPVPGVGGNNFSVRYTRDVSFPGGNVRFKVTVNGGYRVWVGNKLVIDRWSDHGLVTETTSRDISAGDRTVRLEYHNQAYPAVLRFKILKK